MLYAGNEENSAKRRKKNGRGNGVEVNGEVRVDGETMKRGRRRLTWRKPSHLPIPVLNCL